MQYIWRFFFQFILVNWTLFRMVRMLLTLGTTPSQIHLIGMSLGAHLAAYVAKAVHGIGRLTGKHIWLAFNAAFWCEERKKPTRCNNQMFIVNKLPVFFRFLWPCIVSKVWREKTNKMQQLDVYYQLCLNMFRASLYLPSEEQRPCVTAFGILLWFCWMWLVAVVGRCVVGCERCSHPTTHPLPDAV